MDLILENQTSEQAARILSMQMANDNAIKLLGNLQLEYNKLRQQGITTELLDIAGGVVEWFWDMFRIIRIDQGWYLPVFG